MNLEDLRERRRRERKQDSLQSLPETFYSDVARYLQELKRAREEAAEGAADPYGDPEVRRLTDELQTAESIVESLYERRVGKVVKHASFAAADQPHEREGLTEEERALFDDLVSRITENRKRVLDTLGGEASTEPTDSTESSPDATPDRPSGEAAVADRDDPAGMLADAMGAGGDGSSSASEAGETPTPPGASDTEPSPGEPRSDAPAERTTVRITADVGEIYGVDDRDYHLEAEDVVDLPADNAAPLIEKEAAERL